MTITTTSRNQLGKSVTNVVSVQKQTLLCRGSDLLKLRITDGSLRHLQEQVEPLTETLTNPPPLSRKPLFNGYVPDLIFSAEVGVQ